MNDGLYLNGQALSSPFTHLSTKTFLTLLSWRFFSNLIVLFCAAVEISFLISSFSSVLLCGGPPRDVKLSVGCPDISCPHFEESLASSFARRWFVSPLACSQWSPVVFVNFPFTVCFSLSVRALSFSHSLVVLRRTTTLARGLISTRWEHRLHAHSSLASSTCSR